MIRTFTIDDLLKVAKRENNTKRSFLYVDPFQGKHVPVSPSQSMALFAELAAKVQTQYEEEKLLVIGFAETATAIGSAAAFFNPNAVAFMTTTREEVPDAEYLYFTESHSHAAEQKLAVNGLEKWLVKADRVVFAEDEVTTGNTIAKLIRVLREKYPQLPLQFGIASILNSMPDERLQEFEAKGIPCTYIARIPFAYRTDEVDLYRYEPLVSEPYQPCAVHIDETVIGGAWNARKIESTANIRKACNCFVKRALEFTDDSIPSNLLVLGTEECMFPGMLLGAALEHHGHTVHFHATTRSPIEVSRHEDYPLHERFPLCSLYDAQRRTFIYDLNAYDEVIIVTDAPHPEQGLAGLAGALEYCGNTHIRLIRWSEEV
ncbi:MAG: phosphoribosyltransferase family protein [Oscillospiraceae bacterium]|nr:phosphoribosyltransferase family protein [Oscillospiraceae bacterium]